MCHRISGWNADVNSRICDIRSIQVRVFTNMPVDVTTSFNGTRFTMYNSKSQRLP